MNHTQTRIYNYLTNIISLNNIPVMISYQNIANRLGISEITVKRNLDDMILNRHIYNARLGNNIVYYTKPIDIDKDFVCYIKNK